MKQTNETTACSEWYEGAVRKDHGKRGPRTMRMDCHTNGRRGRVTADRSSEVSRSDVWWQADHRNIINQLITE